MKCLLIIGLTGILACNIYNNTNENNAVLIDNGVPIDSIVGLWKNVLENVNIGTTIVEVNYIQINKDKMIFEYSKLNPQYVCEYSEYPHNQITYEKGIFKCIHFHHKVYLNDSSSLVLISQDTVQTGYPDTIRYIKSNDDLSGKQACTPLGTGYHFN
jgi:hypothetical protein